jgi:hypothetical protein
MPGIYVSWTNSTVVCVRHVHFGPALIIDGGTSTIMHVQVV